jgi:hypothetical protein
MGLRRDATLNNPHAAIIRAGEKFYVSAARLDVRAKPLQSLETGSGKLNRI